MKKVVMAKNEPEIDVKETSDAKYYGIRTKCECFARNTGFITRQCYDSGTFKVLCLDHLTNGNDWSHYLANTLQLLIELLLKKGIEVFEFDTPEELTKFLFENSKTY